jgi:hypothetical protein
VLQLVDLLQLLPLQDSSAAVGPIQLSVSSRSMRAITILQGSFSPDLTAPPAGLRWELKNLTAWCAPVFSQGLRASRASVSEASLQGPQPPDRQAFLEAAPPSFRAGMTSKMPIFEGGRRKGGRRGPWFKQILIAACSRAFPHIRKKYDAPFWNGRMTWTLARYQSERS